MRRQADHDEEHPPDPLSKSERGRSAEEDAEREGAISSQKTTPPRTSDSVTGAARQSLSVTASRLTYEDPMVPVADEMPDVVRVLVLAIEPCMPVRVADEDVAGEPSSLPRGPSSAGQDEERDEHEERDREEDGDVDESSLATTKPASSPEPSPSPEVLPRPEPTGSPSRMKLDPPPSSQRPITVKPAGSATAASSS